MYPTEYIWTKELIINTGINIDTVKASNPKSQKILKNSLSNHLDKLIDTDITAIKFIIQINKYTFYITVVLTH